MTDEERVHEEDRATERLGAEWANGRTSTLVGFVSELRRSQFHTPALVEMQRRLTCRHTSVG